MYRAEPRIREQTKQKITSEGITPVGPAALTPLKEFVMNNSKQQRATHLSVSQKKKRRRLQKVPGAFVEIVPASSQTGY